MKLSDADKQWMQDAGIDLEEIKQAIPFIVFTIVVFIGIAIGYRFTPLYYELKNPHIHKIRNVEIQMSPAMERLMEYNEAIWDGWNEK